MKKILIALMAAGLLAACDNTQDEPEAQVNEAPEVEVQVQTDSEEQGDDSSATDQSDVEENQTGDLLQDVQDQADQVSKDIENNVNSLTEQGKEAAEQLGQDAKDVIDQTQTSAQQLAEEAEKALNALTDGNTDDAKQVIGPDGEVLTLESCAAFTYDPENMDAKTRAKVEACEALFAAAQEDTSDSQ
jgi:DNA anti-recombination protein RmuC